MKRLQETDKARHEKFAQVWRSDSRKYFLSDGHILKLALNDPDASYKYGWNYPIARYLAEHVSREFTQERLWMVFQGNLSVRQIIHDLGRDRIRQMRPAHRKASEDSFYGVDPPLGRPQCADQREPVDTNLSPGMQDRHQIGEGI